MQKLVEIRNVTAGYGQKVVLHDFSLDVVKGDFLGITGPNGGGKTTLLKVLLGLLKPMEGTVSFFDNDKPVKGLSVGYLPQLNNIDKQFPISVRQVIESGLISEKPVLRGFTSEQKQRVSDVVHLMELDDLATRAIGELSGGQRQRALLGRSIVMNPQLLVLDEPNSYIDSSFEVKFYDLLREINKSSTIILVSHDDEALNNLASRVIHIDEKSL